MLNDYFTSMVEVVFTHGGMLDKYIGDAIMAVFGTGMGQPSDADNALTVATDMIRELGRFNQRAARAAGWNRSRSASASPPARCWPARWARAGVSNTR